MIKLWDIMKSELINSENSRKTVSMVSLRKSKRLEHRLAKKFTIFRQRSIQTDILPWCAGHPGYAAQPLSMSQMQSWRNDQGVKPAKKIPNIV